MGYVDGVLDANEKVLLDLYSTNILEWSFVEQMVVTNRVCGMTRNQLIKILKKWCDENPAETHNRFEFIVLNSFIMLPIRDCE